MFGLKKFQFGVPKHTSNQPVSPVSYRLNHSKSGNFMYTKKTIRTSSKKTSSDNDHHGTRTRSLSSDSITWGGRNKYKKDFRGGWGGVEKKSVQELEKYAEYKAEETTMGVNGCLKIAEEIRENATKTVVSLHQQGEQITRTHALAADIDHHLTLGEKILESLGGIFSKTWKPKKSHQITGPVITKDDLVRKKGNHLEQRGRLGLTHSFRRTSNSKISLPESTNALRNVEIEKMKQDDALSDLSNILSELKEIAVYMGSELERQNNKALHHFSDEVEEISLRVLNANRRGQYLLK